MDVAFLWVGFEPYPQLMVESVRRHMPSAHIVQMTDQRSRVFDVDEVRRLEYDKHLMTFRLHHLATWPHEQAIILDGDVVLKGDLGHVFDQSFQVALTKRDRKDYPYNSGVMFSRCPEFWKQAAQWLKKHPALWDWDGDQAAIKEIAPQFDVLELRCEDYNWSPSSPTDTSTALAWHYKGKRRKEWLRMQLPKMPKKRYPC